MNKKTVTSEAKQIVKKTPSSHLVLYTFIIGVILSLSSLSLFAEIAEEVFEQETHHIDEVISQLVYSWRNPVFTDIMNIVTLFGAELLVVGVILMLLYLLRKKYTKEALLLFVTVSIGICLNLILKLIYQRPRPDYDPLMDLTSYSFPSGHSMNAFIFYAVLAYLYYSFSKKRRTQIIVSIAAAITILLVGFSRVYLGVHYPSDVLAGFIAGFFVVITTILLERVLHYLRHRKEKINE